MAESREEIRMHVVYSKAANYKRCGVTGAYGGVNPNGEVIADFFVEYKEPPEELHLEVRKGKVNEVDRKGGDKFIREMQVGLVLRPDIALSVGNWLIRQAEKAGITSELIEKGNAADSSTGVH